MVLVHPRNRGKGAALATGIGAALEGGAGVIVTLDADGQHPPEEIPRLVAPVARGDADLVLGARARSGAMPWGRRCANWLSAALARGCPVCSVPVPTLYGGRPSHFGYWVDTWRLARIFTRYGREIIFGPR